MNRFSFLLIALFFSTTNFSQTQFDQFDDRSDVSSVVISKEMFDLMIQFAGSSEEAKAYVELIKDINVLKVYSTESKQVSLLMDTAVKSYVSESNLKLFLKSKDNEISIVIYTIDQKNSIIELLMYVNGINADGALNEAGQTPKGIILSIKGDIDLDKVAMLAKELKITGAEHLKKIEQ